MTPGIHYLTDLNKLVTSASQDLHDTALAQASAATGRLFGEIVFLALLALVCLGGVVVGWPGAHPTAQEAGRRGPAGAQRRLRPGPTARLRPPRGRHHHRGVQRHGLHVEERSRPRPWRSRPRTCRIPSCSRPLPGRTGHALQASVDTLAIRIRERELQRQLLHEAATHDSLTGLLNRAAVFDFLTHDVSRRREAGETVAVLFIDLDGLKPLNDTYGHEVGDTAILATAMALMQATQECDVVGRLGGDEFLVVLCHDHSCNGDTVVERIRDSVAQCRIPVQDVLVPLEASVGVALGAVRHRHRPHAAGAPGRRGHVRGQEDGPGHPGPVHLRQQLSLLPPSATHSASPAIERARLTDASRRRRPRWRPSATSIPSKSARVLMRNWSSGPWPAAISRSAPRSTAPGRTPPQGRVARHQDAPRGRARVRLAVVGGQTRRCTGVPGAELGRCPRQRRHDVGDDHTPAVGGQELVHPRGEPDAPRGRGALVDGDQDRHDA